MSLKTVEIGTSYKGVLKTVEIGTSYKGVLKTTKKVKRRTTKWQEYHEARRAFELETLGLVQDELMFDQIEEYRINLFESVTIGVPHRPVRHKENH